MISFGDIATNVSSIAPKLLRTMAIMLVFLACAYVLSSITLPDWLLYALWVVGFVAFSVLMSLQDCPPSSIMFEGRPHDLVYINEEEKTAVVEMANHDGKPSGYVTKDGKMVLAFEPRPVSKEEYNSIKNDLQQWATGLMVELIGPEGFNVAATRAAKNCIERPRNCIEKMRRVNRQNRRGRDKDINDLENDLKQFARLKIRQARRRSPEDLRNYRDAQRKFPKL